jgi:hypothetical protein
MYISSLLLPLPNPSHAAYPQPADVAGEHPAELVPPMAHRLVQMSIPRSARRSSTFRKDSGD